MGYPSIRSVDANFFTDKLRELKEKPANAVEGSALVGTPYPKKWIENNESWGYGTGHTNYYFCALLHPSKGLYIPYVWADEHNIWIRVGKRMKLEEAKAVSLVRYAMRNAAPLTDQSTKEEA